MKMTFNAHFVGKTLTSPCLNTLQNLRNRDGFFSVGREALVVTLFHMHTHAHTHTVALLSLPSHFPPPKDFEHFMEMLFSPQTVAFLLRSHQAACLLAFPGLRSQRGQLQPSHKCNVSDVPVVTMLSLWQVKVLGWPCGAARGRAAP